MNIAVMLTSDSVLYMYMYMLLDISVNVPCMQVDLTAANFDKIDI